MDEAYGIAGRKKAEYSDKYSTYALYQRLAGEVESRNVETRFMMTEEKRQKTLLSATEDVAAEDQILLFPDAPQSRKQENKSQKTNKNEEAKPKIAAGNRLFSKPLQAATEIANRMKERIGIDTPKGKRITKLNLERAQRIADAYQNQETNPMTLKYKPLMKP